MVVDVCEEPLGLFRHGVRLASGPAAVVDDPYTTPHVLLRPPPPTTHLIIDRLLLDVCSVNTILRLRSSLFPA